jgi:hypothetical protein
MTVKLARVLTRLVSSGIAPSLHDLDMTAIDILLAELEKSGQPDRTITTALCAFLTSKSDEITSDLLSDLGADPELFTQLRRRQRDIGSPAYWRVDSDSADVVLDALHLAESALRVMMQERGADVSIKVSAGNPTLPLLGPYEHAIAGIRERHKVPPIRKRVISVSFDMVGSTRTKADAVNFSQGNAESIADIYTAIVEQFLAVETRFYDQLRAFPERFGFVPLENIYVVKGIGDEEWIIISPADDEEWSLRAAAGRVIRAALDLVSRSIELSFGSDDDERQFGVFVPFKAHIDLIDGESINIAQNRFDHFDRFLRTEPASNEQPRRGSASHRKTSDPALVAQLNAGFVVQGLGRRSMAQRADFVGHQVDRVFRGASKGVPAFVTVGDALMRQLDIVLKPTGVDNIDELGIQTPATRGGNSTIVDWMFRIPREQIFKGFDAPYLLHYIFRKFALNTLLTSRNWSNRALEETWKFLNEPASPSGSELLKRLPQGAAW